MTMVRELRDSHDRTKESKGGATDVRTFHVDRPTVMLPTDGSLVDDDTGLKLPGENDPHPDLPGLKVDKVDAKPLLNKIGWSVVMVYYSNDRRFGTPRDNTQAGIKERRVTWSAITTPIPIVRERTIVTQVLNPGGNPTAQEEVIYEEATLNIGQPMMTIAVRVGIQGGLQFGDWEIIDDQVDSVHTINGRDYLFLGADVSQRGDLTEIEYRWLRDKGTPRPNNDPFSSGAIVPPSDSGLIDETKADLLRLPYHDLTYINGAPNIVGDLAKIEKPVRDLKLGEVKVLDADGKIVR